MSKLPVWCPDPDVCGRRPVLPWQRRPRLATEHVDHRFRRSLIFHYVPEASTEIAAFYNPLVRPDRRPATLSEAIGGPCGDYADAEP
jgi:hypothetical protein